MKRPLVMGVVNVTPDSFSDGGRHADREHAITHARRLVEEGADILDIGGESTRPGAQPVAAEIEAERVLPVVRALLDIGRPISIDTTKPEVMRLVIESGADMINDINGFQAPGALEVVASSSVALCVMHKKGDPETMQISPRYENVVREVRSFIARRLQALEAAGIERARVIVDPGFGFGKTLQHNLALLRDLAEICSLGAPVLVGLSRKSMLGAITGRAVDDRIHASVAAALLAACRGARILRVHDVRATVDALAVFSALQDSASSGVVVTS